MFKSCCALGRGFWHKDRGDIKVGNKNRAWQEGRGTFHHSDGFLLIQSSALPWQANQGRNTEEGSLSWKLFEEFGCMVKEGADCSCCFWKGNFICAHRFGCFAYQTAFSAHSTLLHLLVVFFLCWSSFGSKTTFHLKLNITVSPVAGWHPAHDAPCLSPKWHLR